MKAITVVKKFCKENNLDLESGGGFRTAKDWGKRGEKYGIMSKGIIMHDGGDLAPYLNYAYERPELMEEFTKYLNEHGYWNEQCTGWYTAIYKLDS
tara:strand:+ start:27 stop:314 length:288 start_codon:yes stop_codon:yes gene_type:complete